MIPFGEYQPDVPAIVPGGLRGGKNIFPRPAGSYGPMASFVAAISALATRCQGAAAFADSAGNINLFAGTATKLYRAAPGVSAFSDVSQGGGYSASVDQMWEFLQFGSRVIGIQFSNNPQSYVMGSSALFADLAAGAPKARHGAVVANNFVMLGNTNDGVNGAQPDGLWWNGIGDPTNWPTPGTSAAAAVQSGRTNLSGSGGWIQSIVPYVGPLDAVVLMERRLVRVQYIGGTDIFALAPIENAQGTPAPYCSIGYRKHLYYLGDDGFYRCDGAESLPIGAGKVDKTFYTDVNQSYMYRIQSVIDPINKLWIIAYPSSASSSGNPDKLLIYGLVSNRWAPPTQISIESLCKLMSLGYTLEQLDAFGNLDTLPASLDSRVWTGGKQLLAAFDTTHALGYFTGTNMAAELITGDFDLQRRQRVRGARPLIDGGVPTVALGQKNTPQDAATFTGDVAVGVDQMAPFKHDTRYASLDIKVPAAAVWTHATGFELDTVPTSKR